ncbi:MAG: hypothetical protein E7632_06740 [Ruminococcaceae bacterium]|nr:hypothetical protein [Oscillospiraceae bacterium]
MNDTAARLNAIIDENLALLDGESFCALERRIVQLKERAFLIMRQDSLIESENRAEEFDAMFRHAAIPGEAPAESGDYLTSRAGASTFSDKLTVCRYLAEGLKNRSTDTLARLFPGEALTASPRIAYFQNAYADAAFRIFSGSFDTPSVTYAADFTAVCEEVYYGRADLCMLPLDSSRDAKLISFYRLIDKYELNPVMSCDVTSPDGGVTTRYALLRRSIALPDASLFDRPGSCFLEFTLVPDENASLGDVLAAAKECGLSLYKVDSIPLTYSDSDFACDVILKVGSRLGLTAFALFLTLAVPQYEPLGIYRHIPGEA